MQQITQAYRQASAQVIELLGDQTCPDRPTSNQIQQIVHSWQKFVLAQLDEMTALRFEGVRAQLATPMSWHSFTDEGASAYTSYLTMKQQIQWLAQRVENGQARITVTGDNNVISGGDISQSPIQQGVNSQQEQKVEYATPSRQDLATLVDLLGKHIDELGLASDDRRKVDAQLATINAQLIDEPNPSIIREAFGTIKNITEGAIGSLLASGAQPAVWGALASILGLA